MWQTEEVLGGVTTGANLEIGLKGMSGNNFGICIVCGCGGGFILLDYFMTGLELRSCEDLTTDSLSECF